MVTDILIASVDGLKGFSEAINSIFPQTVVQRCIIHQIRYSMKYVGSKYQKEFMADLKKVYKAPTKDAAEKALLELEEKWKSPEYIEKSEKFERDYDKSLPKLFDLIDIHSIYLDHRVEDEISKLKQELSIADQDEDDEWRLRRRSGAIKAVLRYFKWVT